MFAICEVCFPPGADLAVVDMIPIGPCQVCGAWDERGGARPSVKLFYSDPRPAYACAGIVNDGVAKLPIAMAGELPQWVHSKD